MSKKKKKPSLRDVIAVQLSNKGYDLDIDSFSDKSGSWIELKKGDITVAISFDYEGENIDSISVYQDYEVKTTQSTKLM